tara:strand:- start:3840 stop:4820 length:981 start_codon:yes stop_codon:yes gene_type:complete
MSIICKVTRGALTESFHVVFAVAVDETGQTVYSTGDPNYLTCIRSALKPFQAAAAVKTGAVDEANFSDKEIALMCASHTGEEIHVNTAQSMLGKIGLTLDDFECGIHPPSDTASHHKLIKDGKKANASHNNCSGKHAGMLALAKYLGHGIKGYIQKNHPVQQTIFKLIESLTGLQNIPTEIDGCSAPTPFMTLENIAKLFQNLAAETTPELSRVYQAMCTNPILVSGTNCFDTLFIDALAGRGITKIGGESIRGIALKKSDGGSIGLAIKVLDGNFRALSVATMKLLEHLNLLTDLEFKKLDKFSSKILKNHKELEIGRIEAIIEN